MIIKKMLSPYIPFEHGIKRFFIGDKDSWFSVGNYYPIKANFRLKKWLFDLKLNNFPSRSFPEQNKAALFLDEYLIENGFVLLTEGQWEKYSVLI